MPFTIIFRLLIIEIQKNLKLSLMNTLQIFCDLDTFFYMVTHQEESLTDNFLLKNVI